MIDATVLAFLAGLLTMAYLVAVVAFHRFWRETRDRFFALFALAFALLALQRTASVFVGRENLTALLLLRLTAFLVIIAAIVAKNRGVR